MEIGEFCPFEQLEMNASAFRETRGIGGEDITIEDAINDLEIRAVAPEPHSQNGKFKKIRYTGRRKQLHSKN